MNTIAAETEKNMQGCSLILAPVLLGTSTFFWQNGEYTVPAATLLILSTFFWIPAFTGLFGLTKNNMPRYSVYGLWVAVFGCVSGICFAFLGYLTAIFSINLQQYLEALSKHPFWSQLLLFASGPLFPLSRISRNVLIAHGADTLFLIPAVFLASKFLRRKAWRKKYKNSIGFHNHTFECCNKCFICCKVLYFAFLNRLL